MRSLVVRAVLTVLVAAGSVYGVAGPLRAADRPVGAEPADRLLRDAKQRLRAGDVRGAAERYARLLWQRPDDAEALNGLGLCRELEGRQAEAVGCYRAALHVAPGYADAANNLAWVLATHPRARMRDGQEAVRRAEQACAASGYGDYQYLDTLGAACSEAGEFERAVEWGEKALGLAREANDRAAAAGIAGRLGGYRNGRAHRAGDAMGGDAQGEARAERGLALVTAGLEREVREELAELLATHHDPRVRNRRLAARLAGPGPLKFGQGAALRGLAPRRFARVPREAQFAEEPGREARQLAIGLVTLSEQREETGERGEAEKLLRVAAGVDPRCRAARRRLGVMLLERGQARGAAEHLAASLLERPDDAEALVRLGEARELAGWGSEAMGCYLAALGIEPEHLEAMNNLAWLLATHPSARIRDARRAVELAGRVCGATSGPRAQHLDTLAAAQAAAGDFEEAMATAETARRLAREEGRRALEEHLRIAGELYREGKTFGGQPAARRMLGEAALARGELEVAEAHLEAALRLEPGERRTLLALGRTAERREDFASALAYQWAALNDASPSMFRLGPTRQLVSGYLGAEEAPLVNRLGELYELNGAAAQALGCYAVALELDPELAAAANNRAWLLATTSDGGLADAEEAVELAQTACELSGRRNAQHLDTLSVAHAAAGQFEEAGRAGREALKLAREAGDRALSAHLELQLELYAAGLPYRDHFAGRVELGRRALEQGEAAAALEHLGVATRLRPENEAAAGLLGRARLLLREQRGEAID